MQRGTRLFTLLLLLLLSSSPSAEPLRIGVAANFKSTLTTLVSLYQSSETGQQDKDIEIIPGATGALTSQIMQGAPFHILFAADVTRPQTLEQQLKVKRRQTYAIGQLAFWVRNASATETAFLQFEDSIAIANPRHAPYGLAATQVLTSLGKKNRLIYGNNVAQAFTFVQTGNAAAGLVSLAQVLEQQIPPHHYWIIPRRYHDSIEQQLVVLKDAPASADRFVDWLSHDAARQAIRDAGYKLTGLDNG